MGSTSNGTGSSHAASTNPAAQAHVTSANPSGPVSASSGHNRPTSSSSSTLCPPVAGSNNTASHSNSGRNPPAPSSYSANPYSSAPSSVAGSGRSDSSNTVSHGTSGVVRKSRWDQCEPRASGPDCSRMATAGSASGGYAVASNGAVKSSGSTVNRKPSGFGSGGGSGGIYGQPPASNSFGGDGFSGMNSHGGNDLVKCHCSQPAVVKTVRKEGPNQGETESETKTEIKFH